MNYYIRGRVAGKFVGGWRYLHQGNVLLPEKEHALTWDADHGATHLKMCQEINASWEFELYPAVEGVTVEMPLVERLIDALNAGLSCARSLDCAASKRDAKLIEYTLLDLEKRRDAACGSSLGQPAKESPAKVNP